MLKIIWICCVQYNRNWLVLLLVMIYYQLPDQQLQAVHVQVRTC